jgi:serine phosphatase RsbU (regulator of sigma subunit)
MTKPRHEQSDMEHESIRLLLIEDNPIDSRLIQSLYRAVCEFSQREEPADDVTMIVVKVEQ